MLEVEEEAGQRLRVLDLREQAGQLGHRNSDVLELLVGIRRGLAAFQPLGEEELHPLAAETRGREEPARVTPGPAGEAGLLEEVEDGKTLVGLLFLLRR